MHNVPVVISFLMATGTFISKTDKYDKEREYVRKNVQAQREQHDC